MEVRVITSLADCYFVLKNNAFTAAPLIALFYKNLKSVNQNLLLAQFVLPLCMHPEYGVKIERAVFGVNRKSSIWTIFDDKKELYDLQERIDELKMITNLSLQHSINNEWLSIDTRIFHITHNEKETHKYSKTSMNKRSINLGRLFSSLSIYEIYSFFGVIPR